MAGSIRRLFDRFLEPVDPHSEQLPCTRQRLNRPGQLVLGSSIALLALLGYGLSWQLSEQLSSRWQLCFPLEEKGLMHDEYRQTLEMIDLLAPATRGQKMRLKQQARVVTLRLGSLCSVVRFYRSQEAALMFVAIGSFSLLSLAVLIGLPKGLLGLNNRTLQTVLLTNSLLLALSVSFLQVGEQQRNVVDNLTSYRDHRDLFLQLQSALANGELPGQPSLALNAATRVAALIRYADAQLEAIPNFAVNLNESRARSVFSAWSQRGLAAPSLPVDASLKEKANP